MFDRIFSAPEDESFFLFGPRGTGKSTWVKSHFEKTLTFDLLHGETYHLLMGSPSQLEDRIPSTFEGWVVIDEVQRIPQLLNAVHRLIENRHLKFVLTGSSARKLKAKGVNLLAGRALTCSLYPLTVGELGKEFELSKSLRFGHLPKAYLTRDPSKYLHSYVTTFLREEVQQEGLTRNLGSFTRFLEAAAFSQGAPLNISAVSSDCGVYRKVVEDYFSILRDLLLSYELPIFTKRAKRELITHRKFYYFDVGVYRILRPKGPLDAPEEIDGIALETLILQEAMAINSYFDLGYTIHYWHTRNHVEVDFVLYGERGLIAVEVKRGHRLRAEDFKGLQLFHEDYPMAKRYLVYTGRNRYVEKDISVYPVDSFLKDLPEILESTAPSK